MTKQVRPAFAPRSLDITVPRSTRRPWSLAEFGRVVFLWSAAFITLGVAWAGSRSDANPTHSSRWILIGLIGALLGSTASTLWLVAGTRNVRGREQWIMSRIDQLRPQIQEVLGFTAASESVGRTGFDDDALVKVENGSRFHRADCLMVSGKDVVSANSTDPSLEPCGVCQP